MTKQEFQESVRTLLGLDQEEHSEIHGMIAVILKDGTIWMLNLDGTDQRAIINEYLSVVRSKCIDEDFDLVAYSTADERIGCYYDFDLDERPDSFQKMSISEREQENLRNLDVSVHKLAEVAGIMVFLSNDDRRMVLFKNVYSVEIIGVQSNFLIWHLNDRFERATKDLIRLTPSFDVVLINGHYVITNLKSVERLDQLTQITINEASRKINDLDDLHLVSNIDRVRELAIGDLRLSRKIIATISESKVVERNIAPARIIQFAQEKREKIGELSYTEDNLQVDVKSKKELRVLLNILNDDLLKSELTEEDYLANSKNILQTQAHGI